MSSVREVLSFLIEGEQASPELLQPDRHAGRATEAVLERGAVEPPPWFVRVLIGVGTWVGASLITAFLALTELLELLWESHAGRILGAALFLGGAFAASRKLRGVLRNQLTLILAFAGQVLVLMEVAELSDSPTLVILFAMALQVGLFFALRDGLFRFVAVLVFIGCGPALFLSIRAEDGISIAIGTGLFTAALGTAAAWVWLQESRLEQPRFDGHGRVFAYALVTGWFGLMGIQAFVRAVAATEGGLDEELRQVVVNPPWLLTLVLLVVSVWVVREVVARSAPSGAAPWPTVAIIGVTAIAALSLNVPGILAALLFLFIGRLRGEPLLSAISLAFLAGFLFYFYYQLDTTLLNKSLWVISTGAAVLVLRAVISRIARVGRFAGERERRDEPALLFGLGLAVFVAVGLTASMTLMKERVLKDGRTVLLELAPVDPRSLMQGDYMRLDYGIARDLERDREQRARLDREGRVVLRLDARGVAELVRVDDGTPPAADELYLRYFMRNRRDLRLGAESFFFEEGSAAVFEEAEYGELRVDASGGSVLVGLRDKNLKPLGP